MLPVPRGGVQIAPTARRPIRPAGYLPGRRGAATLLRAARRRTRAPTGFDAGPESAVARRRAGSRHRRPRRRAGVLTVAGARRRAGILTGRDPDAEPDAERSARRPEPGRAGRHLAEPDLAVDGGRRPVPAGGRPRPPDPSAPGPRRHLSGHRRLGLSGHRRWWSGSWWSVVGGAGCPVGRRGDRDGGLSETGRRGAGDGIAGRRSSRAPGPPHGRPSSRWRAGDRRPQDAAAGTVGRRPCRVAAVEPGERLARQLERCDQLDDAPHDGVHGVGQHAGAPAPAAAEPPSARASTALPARPAAASRCASRTPCSARLARRARCRPVPQSSTPSRCTRRERLRRPAGPRGAPRHRRAAPRAPPTGAAAGPRSRPACHRGRSPGTPARQPVAWPCRQRSTTASSVAPGSVPPERSSGPVTGSRPRARAAARWWRAPAAGVPSPLGDRPISTATSFTVSRPTRRSRSTSRWPGPRRSHRARTRWVASDRSTSAATSSVAGISGRSSSGTVGGRRGAADARRQAAGRR